MMPVSTRRSRDAAALLSAAIATIGILLAASARGLEEYPSCPILDTPPETYADISVGYAPAVKTTAAGWEDVSVISASVAGEVLFIENDLGGDFLTKLQLDTMTLEGYDGGSSGYPLTMADVFLQYSQRYVNGYGLRIDAAPGFYTVMDELSGDGFAVPCGLTLIKATSSGYAVFAGVSVYPGFDQAVDPRLGMRWKTRSGGMICDLAYPESRLTLRTSSGTRVYAGARYLAWPEYSMGDDTREVLRYREARAFGGFAWDVTDGIRFTIEGGFLTERKIEFDAEADDVEMDDTAYGSMGLGWLM